MMNVESLFEQFAGKKIAVVGDVMLDAYLRGGVHRVSPEAPVPIVSLEKQEERLGGAANVALNLVALGAEAIICSVIGNDRDGNRLIEILEEQGISAKGIVQSADRKTTVKTRVIGNNQQLLRIDSEQTDDINAFEQQTIVERIALLLESGIDALIFEDYNKGVLTASVIQQLITICQKNGILTTVDPKKKNFLAYQGVTLFKPNLKELKEGLDIQFSMDGRTDFEFAVNQLEAKLQNEITFITLSELGVFIKKADDQKYVPAHVRNIADVSGAGDTVISVATLCLTIGLPIQEIAEIANLAGGLVCEKSGVVSIEREQLKAELIRIKN
ncbi:MAG: D-glycero-beta-D-manno-heptose-7-phosphate kinase [Crocinitomicaceae bacterium]|nr:MAG: D-glycero-beta-D-manno-heptose-7-phosphate kinase [Crocinitomicaceae bacterium]